MTSDENNKSLGKLSLEQLRAYYAHAYESRSEAESLALQPDKLNEEGYERVCQSIRATGGWGHLYGLPVSEVLFLAFSVFGLLDEVKAWPTSPDPHGAVLQFISHYEPPDIAVDELDELELGLFLNLIFVMRGNLDALFQYGVMLNRLVAEVTEGDDDALFKAVRIDALSMVSGPIASRIAIAHLSGDRGFFDTLSKAITHTKPIRPKPELDDMRLVLTLLEEAKGLDTFSDDDLYHLLVENMELYPESGKDPLAGLKAHIRKHPRSPESQNAI